jgi:hypothetical protein
VLVALLITLSISPTIIELGVAPVRWWATVVAVSGATGLLKAAEGRYFNGQMSASAVAIAMTCVAILTVVVPLARYARRIRQR